MFGKRLFLKRYRVAASLVALSCSHSPDLLRTNEEVLPELVDYHHNTNRMVVAKQSEVGDLLEYISPWKKLSGCIMYGSPSKVSNSFVIAFVKAFSPGCTDISIHHFSKTHANVPHFSLRPLGGKPLAVPTKGGQCFVAVQLLSRGGSIEISSNVGSLQFCAIPRSNPNEKGWDFVLDTVAEP